MSHVAIILVNWNGATDTIACIQSLQTIVSPSYELIVVDNGSTDDSISQLKAYFSELTLIESKTNLGFAGGNNLGLNYALAKDFTQILLLNNDTLVSETFIQNLITVAETNPRYGILSPTILTYPSEKIWYAGGKIDWLRSGGYHFNMGQDFDPVSLTKPAQTCSFLSGCCMLIKREVIEQVGLLDPDYFLYMEDADYCVRVTRAGYELVYVPASKIWHRVSSAVDKQEKEQTIYLRHRNRFLFIKKHGTFWQKLLFYLTFHPYLFAKEQKYRQQNAFDLANGLARVRRQFPLKEVILK